MDAPSLRAIFLSYAREDTDAARRIADALRGFGIEAWFDQNELRGGDAWDQKIRQQIKECALFVPIISANTQSRREGYFRREWKQAAERTRDMADGTPFLLPVVIDATRDAESLGPEERKLVDQRPTRNVAAYELVLKARDVHNQRWLGQEGTLSLQWHRLLQSAVELDPDYAEAHAELAACYVKGGFFLPYTGEQLRQKARAELDIARRLAPDSPAIIRAQGDYSYYAEHDFARAMQHYEAVARMRPNDPTLLNRIGSIQRRQSRWAESLATWRRLEEIDPADFRNFRDVTFLLTAARRFDEALAHARQAEARAPRDLQARFEAAWIPFLARGSTSEMEEFFRRLTQEERDSPTVRWQRLLWGLRRGKLDEALAVADQMNDKMSERGSTLPLEIAFALAASGQWEAARARLAGFPEKMRRETDAADPFDPGFRWSMQGATEALLGHKEQAVQFARKALELMPESVDTLHGASARIWLGIVLAWTGDKEAAITEFARVLRAPNASYWSALTVFSDLTVHVMRTDFLFAPLRGDLRFEALLDDPKNNAPLF